MKKRKLNYSTTVHVQRAIHNETQEELAERIGVSRQTISNIENNKPPTLLNAWLIAQRFEVTIEEIFKFETIN